AVFARIGDRAKQALAIVFHFLAAVRNEQAGVNGLGHRESELQLASGSDRGAEVGELEAGTAMIGGEAPRNARLANVGIAISAAEIIDEPPELPLNLRPLAAAKQVGLIETDEAAQASPLTHGSPGIFCLTALPAGRFSLT